MGAIHDEIESSIAIRHVSRSRHIEFGSLACNSIVQSGNVELDADYVSVVGRYLVCECVCALETNETKSHVVR